LAKVKIKHKIICPIGGHAMVLGYAQDNVFGNSCCQKVIINEIKMSL